MVKLSLFVFSYHLLLQLDDCEATACAPPSLPKGNRLKLEQAGTLTYAFGKNATILCDGSDVYFEQDKDLKGFNVTCLATGRWDRPFQWPKCIEGKLLH